MNNARQGNDSIVVVTSEFHLTPEQHQRITQIVAKQLAAGGPIVLDKGLDLQIRRTQPTILKSEHYARVNELLQTTNRYQERYRSAEAKLRELGVTP